MMSVNSLSKKDTFCSLTKNDLGDKVPKRNGIITPILAKYFLKMLGWRIVGHIPNISQAVVLAVPHTSNEDGLYAIPTLLALDLDINIMGKKELFNVPVLSHFLRWAGIIPIDRDKKGSVLNACLERFNTGQPFFLGIAPEGTRHYRTHWKTGFYYLALQANVPILPVALDYKSKQIRFMEVFVPTGCFQIDFPKILEKYKGIYPKHVSRLSQPLQDMVNES